MNVRRTTENLNSKLPELAKVFEKIKNLNQASISLTNDIKDLFNIWGRELHNEGNPDNDFYRNRMSKRSDINSLLRDEMRRISEFGGVVKDVKRGIVDFYIEHQGEPICLCWKVGEEKITHWHPAREGFSARKPLSDLPHAHVV